MKLQLSNALASVLMSKTFDNGVMYWLLNSLLSLLISVYDGFANVSPARRRYMLQGRAESGSKRYPEKWRSERCFIVGQPA